MNPQPQFCPNCGAQRRRPAAHFCHKCGQALPPAAVVSSEPQPTPKKSRRPLLIGIVLVVIVLIAAVVMIGPGGEILQALLSGDPTSTATPEPLPTDTPAPATETSPATPPTETATPPATATPGDTPTPIPIAPPEPTNTPPSTATPGPTETPLPPPDPDAYKAAISAVVENYGKIKAEAILNLDSSLYEEILTGLALERQKQRICEYEDKGEYFTYDKRNIQSLYITFEDIHHAAALASIEESYSSRERGSGEVINSFDDEYDAEYLLERVGDDWYIYCFQVINEDKPYKECEVILKTPNPCKN